MKKKIIISVVILIVLVVLFLPMSQEKYDDGGTRTYSALTYKIVAWNRMVAKYDEEGNMSGVDRFTKTSVYWYPDNQKSLDELLEMEIEGK